MVAPAVLADPTPAQTARRRPDSGGRNDALVSDAFFAFNIASIVGNFAGGGLARHFRYRRAIAFMFVGLAASIFGAFVVPRAFAALAWFWLPLGGFFGGVFGLFTMYPPPLFPIHLRTTGAGFCYNIGRIAAAVASVVFGWFVPVGNFRGALLCVSALALAAAVRSWWLPGTEATTSPASGAPHINFAMRVG